MVPSANQSMYYNNRFQFVSVANTSSRFSDPKTVESEKGKLSHLSVLMYVAGISKSAEVGMSGLLRNCCRMYLRRLSTFVILAAVPLVTAGTALERICWLSSDDPSAYCRMSFTRVCAFMLF